MFIPNPHRPSTAYPYRWRGRATLLLSCWNDIRKLATDARAKTHLEEGPSWKGERLSLGGILSGNLPSPN